MSEGITENPHINKEPHDMSCSNELKSALTVLLICSCHREFEARQEKQLT